MTVLADKYDGKRFNSPNDCVYKSNGDLYFTDPPYGLPQREKDPARELDWFGVYRLGTDGKVTLLTKEMTRPNGIGFSPDEKTLYVAQSDPEAAIWKSFPVNADGTLGESRVLFDATKWAKEGRPGLPDGLAVDKQGHIWATGPGGVYCFTPEGKAARPHQHRRAHRQLQVRRRRQNALHLRRHAHLPREDECDGDELLEGPPTRIVPPRGPSIRAGMLPRSDPGRG